MSNIENFYQNLTALENQAVIEGNRLILHPEYIEGQQRALALAKKILVMWCKDELKSVTTKTN